jgi:hypothetical protein
VQRSAEEQQQAFQQLGCGTLCYLRTLDYNSVKSLVGPDADIEPNETAVCLVDADGSPRLIRGTVADVMIAAEEHGVAVVPVH